MITREFVKNSHHRTRLQELDSSGAIDHTADKKYNQVIDRINAQTDRKQNQNNKNLSSPVAANTQTNLARDDYVKKFETILGSHGGLTRFQYKFRTDYAIPVKNIVKKYRELFPDDRSNNIDELYSSGKISSSEYTARLVEELKNIFYIYVHSMREAAAQSKLYKGLDNETDGGDVYLIHRPVSEEENLGVSFQSSMLAGHRADSMITSVWLFVTDLGAIPEQGDTAYEVDTRVKQYDAKNTNWLKYILLLENRRPYENFITKNGTYIRSQSGDIVRAVINSRQVLSTDAVDQMITRFVRHLIEQAWDVVRLPVADNNLDEQVSVTPIGITFVGANTIKPGNFDALERARDDDGNRMNEYLIALACSNNNSQLQNSEYFDRFISMIDNVNRMTKKSVQISFVCLVNETRKH